MNSIIMQLIEIPGWVKIYRLLLISLFLMASSNSNAQTDFDKKINSLLSGSVPQIHCEELKAKIENHENIILLDTRTKEEYEVSKIKDARFIDYDDFDAAMVKDISKDEEIIVYCSVGYRSEKIGEKLQKMGYTNVLNLYGGIFDWKNKNNEVLNGTKQATDSVHTYNKNWSKWLFNGVKVYE